MLNLARNLLVKTILSNLLSFIDYRNKSFSVFNGLKVCCRWEWRRKLDSSSEGASRCYKFKSTFDLNGLSEHLGRQEIMAARYTRSCCGYRPMSVYATGWREEEHIIQIKTATTTMFIADDISTDDHHHIDAPILGGISRWPKKTEPRWVPGGKD